METPIKRYYIATMTENERNFANRVLRTLNSIADPRTGIVDIDWTELINAVRILTGLEAIDSYKLLKKMEEYGAIQLKPFVRVLRSEI